MARIEFTPNLARHVACPPGEIGGHTLREALDNVFVANPMLRGYLLDDQGALRRHMVIFVDGMPARDRVRLDDAIGEDAEIFVFQALSGG